MKKTLLIAAVLSMTVTATWADGSASKYDTAIDATIGENKFNQSQERPDSVVWKFTADKNYLAKVGPLDGSYDYVYVSTIIKDAATQKSDTIDLNGASADYPTKYFPFAKGSTYYMTIVAKGETGINLNVEENDNIDGGLSADKPVTILLDKVNFLGNAYSSDYNGYNAHAKFDATETGVLVLTNSNYFSVDCNGNNYTGEYSNSTYQIKIPVETGKSYNFTFSLYSPTAFKAELTFPTQGSIDIPFAAIEGENTVPADNKDYYYTYTPSSTGYLNISSDKSLPGGCVKVYESKYAIQYDQVKAKSETGSYNVRVEIQYQPTTPYYIVVSRTDKAEADETFTLAMEAYKQGETEDSPIAIDELPATKTIPTAQGTYYYSVNVPANTNKFLHVETGLGENANDGTLVGIYPKGSSIYGGVKGFDNLDLAVSNTVDQTYLIKVTSAESTPITFTASYKDINKGDLITDPADAKLGKNTVTANGTRYYTYTPTKNCKLVLTATPEMTVSFPMGTGMWDGNYDVTKKGVDYYFAANGGTPYLIKLENCVAGDEFSISEDEFEQGETKDNPISVEGNEYTVDKDKATNLWLSYKAKKNGILTISCDAVYDYSSMIEFGKKDDLYLTGMMSTEVDPTTGDSKTIYATTLAVSEGDEIIVHTQLNSLTEDTKITFTERDFTEGETVDMPYVIEVGKPVSLPVATRNAPVWVKAKLGVGKAEFKADNYLSGDYFKNLTDAKSSANATSFYFNADYTTSEATYNYSIDVKEGEEGDFYFYIYSTNMITKLELIKSNVSTDGIATIDNTDTEDIDVYSINGSKVATVKNITSANLKSGVYVIYSNGKAKKIVVR